jgi:hypothetical protein
VNLLNRKGSVADPVIVQAPLPEKAGGKNAPTLKQREARELRAKQLKGAPQTRKEKQARLREIRAETMEALKSTDVSKLPKNERVPELVFARDQIDTRRNLASSILVVIVIYFVGTSIAGAARSDVFRTSLLFLSIFWFLGIGVDTFIAASTIERRIRKQWPETTVRVRSYVFRRALTIKRWRRPAVRPVPAENNWVRWGR